MKSIRSHIKYPQGHSPTSSIIRKVDEPVRDVTWNSTYLYSNSRLHLDSPVYNGTSFQLKRDLNEAI